MVHFARENFAKKYAKNIQRKTLGMKIWIKGTDWVEVLLACHVQTFRFKGGRKRVEQEKQRKTVKLKQLDNKIFQD